MFEGKKIRFTTRIIGSAFEKWKDQLQEGVIIKFQGNIAEGKIGPCGSYMVVYNPKILDAYKTKLERIEPEKAISGQACDSPNEKVAIFTESDETV